MKICVLGFDGAAPSVLFQDERLTNIRRLMELGTYGALQGVLPPGPIPGWICLAASQDPGSLGVYGPHNREYHSYSPAAAGVPPPLQGAALWDAVGTAGKKSIIMATPPNSSPRRVNGISVGCFLGPNGAADDFTFPTPIKDEIRNLVGEYAADVQLSPDQSKDAMRDRIFEVSRKQWEVARWLMREKEWDYFHFVDIGLDRVQRAFWEFHDPAHPRYRPDNRYQHVVADYYLWLDEQIGGVLELVDAETAILLASPGGMQRLDGAFAINQWLLQEGLLALKTPPGAGVTPFDHLDIDWASTRAWAGEGPLAPIYFNLQGRESQGIIPPADCGSFENELTAKLHSFSANRPFAVQVLKPGEIYRQLRGGAPDLMLQFGEGRSSVASVGHPDIYLADVVHGCTPMASGLFVLTAPNSPLTGEYEEAHLLDMAPTLLDLAGYQIPTSMQGRSLVAGMEKKSGDTPGDEQIILDRLAGLGYV